MPTIHVNGAKIYYEEHGNGPETIVFAHGLLWSGHIYENLDQITVPTLIIVGEQDVATPPEKAERMHARIQGSKLVVIPGAGHTSTIEEPDAVNAVIEEFLNSLSLAPN